MPRCSQRSAITVSPEIANAASEARNPTTFAIATGERIPESFWSDVFTAPGATEFTRMPSFMNFSPGLKLSCQFL